MFVPIMSQGWHEITFLHWSCDAELLSRVLPPGLTVDTYEDSAWISLTPFFLRGLGPPFLPSALGMDFPEMNLRTYVVGAQGAGIWFFSLDAGKLLPVLGARTLFGLPYFRATMSVDITGNENTYRSRRANSGPVATVRIVKGSAIEKPSPLDTFLTERYRLYSIHRKRLITLPVVHPPWSLRSARILQLEENVRKFMKVEFPSRMFLAHHSVGVDAWIGPPRRSV